MLEEWRLEDWRLRGCSKGVNPRRLIERKTGTKLTRNKINWADTDKI